MKRLAILLLLLGIVGCGTNSSSSENEYLYVTGEISMIQDENIYVECTSLVKDEDSLTDEGYACGVKTNATTIIEKASGGSITLEELKQMHEQLNENDKLIAKVYLTEDIELKLGNEIYTASKIILSN